MPVLFFGGKMKYIFKLPDIKTSMDEVMIIAHRLSLGQQQRKALQVRDTTIETTGISIPVWVRHNQTDEPAQEASCHYKITSARRPEKVVEQIKDGWHIYLTGSLQAQALDDIKDGGSEFLSLTHHDITTKSVATYPVIHQVTIAAK